MIGNKPINPTREESVTSELDGVFYYNMSTFQYYHNDVKTSKPAGEITLDKFLNKVQNPRQDTIELYNAIKAATEAKDEALRAQLKSRLYYFTPAVYVNDCRRYDSIRNFTGLMPLDFDKIHDAADFRDYLADEYPFIIAAWLSTSGYGVRALAKIPVVNNVDEYKALFYGIRDVLGIYNGFDMAPQNCVLPLFLSYDADMKQNHFPEIFTQVGVNLKALAYAIPQEYKPVHTSPGKLKYIEKTMVTAISKIHDNGHPQLRSAAVSLGGYVGAGYIDETAAHQMMCSIIRSNTYLNKKPQVYERTALDMIRYGKSKPLYIEDK